MRLLVFIATLFFLVPAYSQSPGNTDSLLNELHEAIGNKWQYEEKKLERIDSYKRELQRAPKSQKFNQYLKIYDEYKSFIYDSAFTYTQKLFQSAYESKDPLKIAQAKIKLGFIQISSGMFSEALDSLKTVRGKDLPDSIKVEFYSLVARTYYDLIDFNRDKFYSNIYNKLGNQYIDSALFYSDPKNQAQYLSLQGLKNLKTGNLENAILDFEELLTKHKHILTDPQLAIASSTLSFIYIKLGKPEKAIGLMCIAALADLRSSTRETVAMLNLAELLYKADDVKNAYAFIKEANDEANFYGARHRKIQVAALFPLIEGKELNTVQAQRKLFFLYSAGATILSILLIVFAYIVYKQFKNLQAAKKIISEANDNLMQINHKLREADKIKEEYIGYYFNINTEYLGKIEAFKKAIDLKLMTKKIDDIRYIVNNINLKKEREELYFSFDKVFLKLFPDFVTTFNSYFKEEDRIVLKDNQLLTTELRIFALIRMGIHDTEKIAKILDYSINTIYSYKARVKSKSILQNEDFERKIMEIQAL